MPAAITRLRRDQRIRDLRRVPGLEFWFSIKDAADILAANGTMVLGRDKSGKSNTNCLVQDGSNFNGTTFSALTAFGTGDFSCSMRLMCFTVTSGKRLFASAAGGFVLAVNTGGTILTSKNGGSTASATSTGTITAMQEVVVGCTRSGTSLTYYFDGAASGTATDNLDYTVGITRLLIATADNSAIDGLMKWARVYNSALTAPQMLADAQGVVQSGCVFNADMSVATRGASSVVELSSGAKTVTINSSGATGARISGARDVYQGTTASQATHLPWSGTNYGWLPGVALNSLSTPSVVLGDDLDAIARVSLDDWTPTLQNVIMSKWGATASFFVDVNGTANAVRFFMTIDGSTTIFVTSSAVPSVADGAILWIRVTRVKSTGAVRFYTCPDQSTVPTSGQWIELGTAQILSAGNAIYAGSSNVQFGANLTPPSSGNLKGKLYYGEVRNGIDGIALCRCNPSEATDGAPSWTSSTGEVWTVNTSGGLPATIVGRSQIVTDGSDDYGKTPPFPLVQPEWVMMVGRQLSWTINRAIFDSNTSNTLQIYTKTGTPSVAMSDGTHDGTIFTTWVLTPPAAIIQAVFNGASSTLQKDNGAAVTANTISAAVAANGFTFGSQADGTAASNTSVNEVAILSRAPSARLLSRVAKYESRRWAIAI